MLRGGLKLTWSVALGGSSGCKTFLPSTFSGAEHWGRKLLPPISSCSARMGGKAAWPGWQQEWHSKSGLASRQSC